MKSENPTLCPFAIDASSLQVLKHSFESVYDIHNPPIVQSVYSRTIAKLFVILDTEFYGLKIFQQNATRMLAWNW